MNLRGRGFSRRDGGTSVLPLPSTDQESVLSDGGWRRASGTICQGDWKEPHGKGQTQGFLPLGNWGQGWSGALFILGEAGRSTGWYE